MPVICFVVTHPTQFEVPFYRAVANIQSNWALEVIYTVAQGSVEKFDKELDRNIKWGFPLYEGYISHGMPYGSGAAKIEKLLQDRKIDLLITNSYKDGYEHFVQAAHKVGIPVALRIDSVLLGKSFIEKWARRILLAKYYNQFVAFFPTGSPTHNYLLAMGKKERDLFWFPYCTDNEFFANGHTQEQVQRLRTSLQINENDKIVLAVCKFNERENPFDLLKAFCQLNNPNLHLVMIGDGPQTADLKHYAANHPHLHIQFPGYVQYTELPAWYHITKVFVHTALDEPWGVSVQEALAAGCAVVASSRVGSAYDLIVEGKNGYQYPVKNVLALADFLNKALQIPTAKVAEETSRILQKWNYQTAWKEMQQAAEKILQRQPTK